MRKHTFIILTGLFAIMFLVYSCGKSENIVDTEVPTNNTVILPELGTIASTNITTVGFKSGGEVIKRGNVNIIDRGVCWHTSPNPTVSHSKVGVLSIAGTGAFVSEISGLNHNTRYYVRAFAETKEGFVYGNEIVVTTLDLATPQMQTDSTIIIGTNTARFGGTILANGGDAIVERGVVFGSMETVTLENGQKASSEGTQHSYVTVMTGLSPATTYYVRAYARNSRGTGYGKAIKFNTIAGGNVRYTLSKKTSPTADELDAYQKIEAAMDKAIFYYNTYTLIDKVLTVEYNTSVATADGNFSGNIRFGLGRVYMNPGTAMHEIAHTIGLGTHTFWFNNLIVGGIYTGKHANALHQWITKDDKATILEDGYAHAKPYQFNNPGAVQSELDYIYHALIMDGMRKDGLPIK